MDAPPVTPAHERWRQRWRGLRLSAGQGNAFLRALAREASPWRPQSVQRGTIRVDGVQAAVEIVRDASGVPHIFARNADDAMFGLGYVQAQDRFWQMEFFRRVAAGRMAEIVGPDGLAADRLMRHIGVHRAAAKGWAAMPSALQAVYLPYEAGVNAALASQPLPLEIRLLDYQPEPWRAQDCVLWSKLLAFMLSPAWEAQILRARLVEAVGLEAMLAVDRGYPADGPVVAPPGAPYGALSSDLHAVYADVARATGLGGASQGSNNWAIDAAHSASGQALLACDPHLTAVAPPHAYFVSLDCPEFQAAGASLPGLPGLIWGFNRRIAWGPTAGLASTQDCFVEEFEPGSDRYRTPEGWATAEIVEERITVRGFPGETQRVRVTRHGPVVSPEIPGVRQALALQSAVLGAETCAAGVQALLTASNVEEFRAAVAGFPEFNLVFGYADVEGRIGMQMSGSVPQRKRGGGWLPAPGWDAAYDWAGYIPQDELPHVFDPVDGVVWSANNAPQDAAAATFPGEYLDGYRAQRLGDRIRATLPHGADDARRLQVDRFSIPLSKLRDHLAVVEPAGRDEQRVMEQVRGWDGVMTRESVAAAVVAATFSRLLEAALRAKLGNAVAIYLGDAHAIPNLNVIAGRGASLVMGLLDEAPVGWFGPVGAGVEGRAVWNAALTRAFRDGVALLRDRLGRDPGRWTWGRCHRLSLKHGLADAPALARLFNRGPLPFGGDPNTVFQAGPISVDPLAPVTAIPALRLIMEMSDPPRAEFALAGEQVAGRGGRRAGPLLGDWLEGRTRPLTTSRAELEAAASERLVLEPGG